MTPSSHINNDTPECEVTTNKDLTLLSLSLASRLGTISFIFKSSNNIPCVCMVAAEAGLSFEGYNFF